MFTFLNIIGGKLNAWLGPSPFGRVVALLLALVFIAFSLFYGYARYSVREERQQDVKDLKTSTEIQKAIDKGN